MLAQAVGARGEEGEEAEVSEDLKLLADFVADVAAQTKLIAQRL
jgi:hypothetical protein